MHLKPLLLLLLLTASCAPMKRSKLFKSGEVQQAEFSKTISCQTVGNLMIVDVIVNGQPAKFLFDTGAPNVISPELAAELNLKTETSVKVNDSGGNRETQECVMIDTLTLGGVNFMNLGAVVVNLQANDVIGCMKIDGIFGANSMRQAFWELDFENKNIRFTNNISNLSDTSEFSKLSFVPANSGTPRVTLSLDNVQIEKVTFDTGSGGHLKVPKSDFKKLKAKRNELKYISSIGTTSYGVYGLAKSDTTFYSLIDSVRIGSAVIEENMVVSFHNTSKLLGVRWMDNYKIILDWNSNAIYMKESTPYAYNSLDNFGFGLNFKDKGIFVGSLFFQSEAQNKLQIGDQILAVNGENFEKLPEEEYCAAMFDVSLSEKYGDEIEVKIKRGEEVSTVTLKKESRL